jgi:hypothetical protein
MKHTKKAGFVPFHSANEERYIKDKINLYYADCLAQCFYTLRYTNYKNSLLLQKIGHHYGINMFDVIKILNKAFEYTSYTWIKMGNLVDLAGRLLDILNDKEATLVFLESSIIKLWPNHFVVIYRSGSNIMIRDPQISARHESFQANYTLFDYLKDGKYSYLYLLNDATNEHTPYDGVKREHICDVLNCELYEEKDRLERKKHKQHTKKYKQYMKKLYEVTNHSYNGNMPELIEPKLSDPPSKNDVPSLYRFQDRPNSFNNVPKLIPNYHELYRISPVNYNEQSAANSAENYTVNDARENVTTPFSIGWNAPVENDSVANAANGWNAPAANGWNATNGWNAPAANGWNADVSSFETVN